MAELGTANIGGRAVPAWVLESTAEQVDNSKWFSRPNLLYNWYFVGGGSQQGGGQFPINQRGQTSYTNAQTIKYTIDGWILGWNKTMTVTESGLVFDPYPELFQQVDPVVAAQIVGKLITATVLDSENHLYTVSEVYNGTDTITDPDTKVSFAPNHGGKPHSFLIGANNAIAAKLELGPGQTLAHQDEDGNWVLNEIPKFGAELAKCQRYLRTYDVVWATAPSTASEYLQIQAVYEPMAGVPTITVGSIANFGGTEQPGLSVVSTQKSENAWWIVKLNQSVSANTMLQLKDVFLEAPI